MSDHGIKVPEQVSVTGFDDSIYARMVRPRLTTVHQDVGQKAHLAFSRLLRMVAGEQLKEFNIKKSGVPCKKRFCENMNRSFKRI